MYSGVEGPAVQNSSTSKLETNNSNRNINSSTLSSTISGIDTSSTRPICKYVTSKQSCPYGKQCRFRHPVTSQPDKPVCRHYLLSRCRYGERCKFRHPKPIDDHDNSSSPLLLDVNDFPSITTTTSQSKQCCHSNFAPVNISDHPLDTQPETRRIRHHHDGTKTVPTEIQLDAFFKRAATITPRPAIPRPRPKKSGSDGSSASMKALELEKLEMKLLATEHKVLEKGLDKSVHVIQFEPTNPDWAQYNIPVLQAIVVFPVTYPEQLFSIKLVDDGKLSKSCLEAINTELDKEIKLMNSDKLISESPIFRSVLNWLDKNIAQIVGKILEDEKPDLDPDNYETDESSEYSDSNEEDDDESSEDETGDLKYIRPVKRGTEVRMMDLQLSKSVATLHFWSMKMTMQCTRCKNIQDVVCKPESIISQMCSHCHSSFSINIHPDILHAANTSLAFMDLLGCKPIDVILSSCESVITCLDCGRENLLKGLSFGQPSTTWCRGCNARLLIGVEQCKFFVHQPGVQNAAMVDMSDRKTGKKKMREKILQEGTPLPDLGTCEHYKKSHRWLRFPCCGKTYPCDVCHDLTEDHPMERANRMICGYCSKEQTYTGIKPCVLCGSDMAYVKGSVFWEGGKGCRNRTKMSRKDVHKYKTSESKSASKKNERVGVKGKTNRDTK